jgi:hypothetical protein
MCGTAKVCQWATVTGQQVWVVTELSQVGGFREHGVQQFDDPSVPAAIPHNVELPFVVGLAAQGDAVWVLAGSPSDQRSHLYHLRDGRADLDVPLSGYPDPVVGRKVQTAPTNNSVVACRDGVYATSTRFPSTTLVDHIVAGRVVGTVDLPAVVSIWLECGPGPGVVAVSGNAEAATTVRPLFNSGNDVGAALPLPDHSEILGACDTGVWLGRSVGDQTKVWWLDANLARQSAPITLSRVVKSASDGCTLWTASVTPQHPEGWTLNAIGMR